MHHTVAKTSRSYPKRIWSPKFCSKHDVRDYSRFSTMLLILCSYMDSWRRAAVCAIFICYDELCCIWAQKESIEVKQQERWTCKDNYDRKTCYLDLQDNKTIISSEMCYVEDFVNIHSDVQEMTLQKLMVSQCYQVALSSHWQNIRCDFVFGCST